MPYPVIVTKDVGGYVSEYQAQTELYRTTAREVRLHECRSACTLALSLPNVCVYHDSVLKFHLAYDPRNHQSNYGVSQQLFSSYPAPVQARLGGLTRDYRVLRGAELIALGIRDCDAPRGPHPAEPKIMLASAAPARTTLSNAPHQPGSEDTLSSLYNGVMSALGIGEDSASRNNYAPVRARPQPLPAQPGLLSAQVPVPPTRPIEIGTQLAAVRTDNVETGNSNMDGLQGVGFEAPSPPRRPDLNDLAYTVSVSLPQVMRGAQPILPAAFVSYADLARARDRFASAPSLIAIKDVSAHELLFTPSDL